MYLEKHMRGKMYYQIQIKQMCRICQNPNDDNSIFQMSNTVLMFNTYIYINCRNGLQIIDKFSFQTRETFFFGGS